MHIIALTTSILIKQYTSQFIPL